MQRAGIAATLLFALVAGPAVAQDGAAGHDTEASTSATSEGGPPSVTKRLIRLSPEPQAQETPPTTSPVISEPPSDEPAEPAVGEDEQKPTPSSRPLLVLFLSLLGIGVLLLVLERVRGWISVNVPLRRIVGGLVIALRLGGLGVILAIVLELLPAGQDWILWGLAILVLVTGWSVRDLFADIVAGAVLAAERRVRKGMWVSGDGFQGTVEGRSLRATWLRDGQGHRLTVPNRTMVAAPMVYDSGAEAEHEVIVRLEGYHDAGRVRLALNDAILSSPWVLAGATPVVLRDPADPVVWRVRSKLLEPRFSVHFEGELLERVEDLLRYTPTEADRQTPVDDTTPPSDTKV
ncbi:MAG: mechanosensitive ion channel domain-containing protein [Myxococcota bacterium]